jgi:hypothetical protein
MRFDGLVGAVIGGFEPAVGSVSGIGAMVEAAVGERSAQPFMEQQEEQRDLDPLGGEAVGVARTVALEQGVALELAQVVAQPVQSVGALGQVEGCEHSLVDFFGAPAADVSAAMQQHFEQANDAPPWQAPQNPVPAGAPANAAPASAWSMARAFVLSMRSAP